MKITFPILIFDFFGLLFSLPVRLSSIGSQLILYTTLHSRLLFLNDFPCLPALFFLSLFLVGGTCCRPSESISVRSSNTRLYKSLLRQLLCKL